MEEGPEDPLLPVEVGWAQTTTSESITPDAWLYGDEGTAAAAAAAAGGELRASSGRRHPLSTSPFVSGVSQQSQWSGDTSSSRSSESEGGSLSSAATSVSPSSLVGSPMQWDEAAAVMLEQMVLTQPRYPSRPLKLDPQQEHHGIFMEQPKVSRRVVGSDQWVCSGGKKGGTEHWAPDGSYGIRKRYGKVRQTGGRYFEYGLLYGSRDDPVEDKSICLFELLPASAPGSGGAKPKGGGAAAGAKQKRRGAPRAAAPPPLAPSSSAAARLGLQAWQRARRHRSSAAAPFEQRSAAQPATFVLASHADQQPAEPVVNVRMSVNIATAPTEAKGGKGSDGSPSKAKFMSFQVESGGSEIELGAIVRQGAGVTLESGQGDFAEWHRRCDREPPFQEGDVIGFDRRGLISRKTRGATMLGVITRKAVR
jgi:hypothetical protein